MKNNLPNRAQKYLVESLNKGMDLDINQEYFNTLKEYYGEGLLTTKPSKPEKSKREKIKDITGADTGGYGGGGPRGKKHDNKDKADNVLFGDTEDGDWGAGAAATAYGIGKAADTIADVLDATGAQKIGDAVGLSKMLPKGGGMMGNILSGIATGAVTAIPGATSKLLRQVSDISGANWFDANLGRIGQSQMELAAQGAGKPWTPLAIPGPAQSKQNPYDPEYQAKKAKAERQEAIEAAEEQERIKKLKGLGYTIP
jgi:hypothetical protein